MDLDIKWCFLITSFYNVVVQIGENVAPQQSCSRPCVARPIDFSSLTEIEGDIL